MDELDDSSSDDEFFFILGAYVDMHQPRRPRLFRDRSNPMVDYTDEEFRMRLRLSKESVLDLLHRVEPQLQNSGRRLGQLPPVHQLLLALRFYSSGSFQVTIMIIYNHYKNCYKINFTHIAHYFIGRLSFACSRI